MDANTPRHEDDLSDLERHLAGWRPAAGGLDADAMLFAAGQAAGRRGRSQLLWPVLCALLTVQAAGLGMWGLSERALRQSLASRLPERAPTLSVPPATVVVVRESSYPPSPGDYLSMRRLMEQDPNGWLAALQPAGSKPLVPPPPQPAILTPRRRDGLFDL
ncbi:MAG: hypothetical protein ACHRXM_30385 [Isosphaerales bacterium]